MHIDKEDGTTILYQAKHTIIKNAKGNPQNLTDLDTDLWKTLSNWIDFINADKSSDFLKTYTSILVTNKAESNNDFITTLNTFKADYNSDKVKLKIDELGNKTQEETPKKYFKKVTKLSKIKLEQF